MEVLHDIEVYVAEDGARFLNKVEAETHEALLYIGKTISAFGHAPVTLAAKAVQAVDHSFFNGIHALARQLKSMHEVMPVGPMTPTIDSVNAPETVRASTEPVLQAEQPPEAPAIGSESPVVASESASESKPAEQPSLKDRWASRESSPQPLEPVQKPDETPRDPAEALPTG